MAERKKLLLRLDPEVYEAVARWAGDDLRSVNAQIEYALRLALRTVGRGGRSGRGGRGADQESNPVAGRDAGTGRAPDDGRDPDDEST